MAFRSPGLFIRGQKGQKDCSLQARMKSSEASDPLTPTLLHSLLAWN